MDSLYDGRKKNGYSVEEAYFHSENKRLIQELREKNGIAETPQNKVEGGVVIDAEARFKERRDENNAQQAPAKKKKAA